MPPTTAWSRDEVELVVADYFAMFQKELVRQPYSKTEHRARLKPLLRNRSDGSIEFKHQNISAVLLNLGNYPYIPGYKPRQNYQALLESVVLEWLEGDRAFLDRAARSPMLNPVAAPGPGAFSGDLRRLVELPPESPTSLQGPGSVSQARRIDFVRRDAENRRLGRIGEQFALEFEKRWLHDVDRRPDLAKRVIWVSESEGDGFGYDIRSFHSDESTKLIEVKATGAGKELPFYVTASEVRVSEAEAARYHLYRVFAVSSEPRLYQLHGALTSVCRLDPAVYSARAR